MARKKQLTNEYFQREHIYSWELGRDRERMEAKNACCKEIEEAFEVISRLDSVIQNAVSVQHVDVVQIIVGCRRCR